MREFNQIIKWVQEICAERPTSFASNFLDDVAQYLDLESASEESLRELCGDKFEELQICKTKEMVRSWLEGITAYIVMGIRENELIEKYLLG